MTTVEATDAAAVEWVALDWGTSHARAWAIGPDGLVLAKARSGEGMGRLARADYPAALERLAGSWRRPSKRLPAVACGMVGAREGWAEAGYRPVGTPLDAIAEGAAKVEAEGFDVRIIPGLSQDDPPDVMRGEETQFAGLVAREPGFEGLVVHPGTHAKWVMIERGAVSAFRTFMTGEAFALMAEKSVLRHVVGPDEEGAGDAFENAVAEAAARPAEVPALLFGVRAAALLEGLAPGAARARLSGLLIGAEIAAARALFPGIDTVTLLGAEALAALYGRALAAAGIGGRLADAEAATLAGLAAAKARLIG